MKIPILSLTIRTIRSISLILLHNCNIKPSLIQEFGKEREKEYFNNLKQTPISNQDK